MNKIILSLIISSTIVVAGEQQGTGEPSNNAAISNETIYQLVCTPVNSTQQDNSQYCVLVPVVTNN